MARRSYTISLMLSMVRTSETRCDENGVSLRSVARELGVDSSQLRRWKTQKALFEQFLRRRHGANINRGATTLHPGYKSCLHEIEDQLLQFIWDEREQGLPVSIRMVIIKDEAFDQKTERSKDQAIRHFVDAHGIVHGFTPTIPRCGKTRCRRLDRADATNDDWIESLYHQHGSKRRFFFAIKKSNYCTDSLGCRI
jgi:hypothetical protein